MRKILLIVSLVFLASCTNSQPTNKTSTPEYPMTQAGSPAEKYCIEKGGTISHESTLSGTMDRIYCTTKDGKKVDAWQYMSDSTITVNTGSVATGVVTPK